MGHVGAWNYVESNSFYIPCANTVSLVNVNYFDLQSSGMVDVSEYFNIEQSNGSSVYYSLTTQNTGMAGKTMVATIQIN